MDIIINACALSVTGKVRKHNEDNYFFNGKWLTPHTREAGALQNARCAAARQLYAVCDGMGGAACGEDASLCCASALAGVHRTLAGMTAGADAYCFNAIADINELVYREMLKRRANGGATLAMLLIDNAGAVCYNVGDSRVYRISGDTGAIAQLSTDDSALAPFIAQGVLTPEQAKTHPMRHQITQHMGLPTAEYTLAPHCTPRMELSAGDTFILCSDGLTDFLYDGEIAAFMQQELAASANAMVQCALDRGGADNITVLLVRAEQAPTKQRWQLFKRNRG